MHAPSGCAATCCATADSTPSLQARAARTRPSSQPRACALGDTTCSATLRPARCSACDSNITVTVHSEGVEVGLYASYEKKRIIFFYSGFFSAYTTGNLKLRQFNPIFPSDVKLNLQLIDCLLIREKQHVRKKKLNFV